jgi:acetyl esterase/lipase
MHTSSRNQLRRLGRNLCGLGLLWTLIAAPAMPQTAQAVDPTKVPVVLRLPGMEQAQVRKGIVFNEAKGLAFDLYRPATAAAPAGTRLPVVVFVSGAERVRDWQWFIDYGRLAAASGLLGIVPDKRYTRNLEGIRNGSADTEALLAWLRGHAGELGLAPDRICLWTFSAGGRLTAVGLRKDGPAVSCLVSFYGVVDLSRDAAGLETGREAFLRQYSPVHALEDPEARRTPLLVVRAGRDNPGLNAGIDQLVATALRRNAPFRLINLPDGDHGFDGLNDNEASRAAVREALRFVREQTGLE